MDTMVRQFDAYLAEFSLHQAVREALIAQMALWKALGTVEQLIGFADDHSIKVALEEFAVDINSPNDITNSVIQQAILLIRENQRLPNNGEDSAE